MMQKVGEEIEINSGINRQAGESLFASLSHSFSIPFSPDTVDKTPMKPRTLLQQLWVRPLFWMVTDAILINIAFALAYYIRYELQWLRAVDPANDVPYVAFLPFISLLTALLLIVYRKEHVYNNRRKVSWFDEIYNIFNGTTSGIMIMIVLVFVYQPTFYSRIIFLYAGALILILLGISRGLKVALLRHWRQRGFGVARLLIVGAGEVARTVMRTVVANPEQGYEIVGFVDDDLTKGQTDIGRFKALGGIGNLLDLLGQEKIDEVVITLPWQYHRKIMSVAALCERENTRVRLVPDVFQMSLSRVEMDEIAGIPLIGIKQSAISGYNLILKRVIDFTVALLGLIFLFPFLALLALAIKLDSPGPVIFTQERVGKGGRRFVVHKFRSMVQDAESRKRELLSLNEADGPLFKIKDDPRMTRLGRFLRRFSLDELPQFYNVLRGEMSLVGPRPSVPTEVEQYQTWHRRRLEIVPGMTGLWQVNGRSDLTFDEMALLDIYYIENWSLPTDIKILLQTLPTVIFRTGAY
jgi:exopolysaccharide biosynthesis polyprenyl glycosylphosphotransferase